VTYLKVGEWEVHVNGGRAALRIRRIDEIGRITGTLFDQPVVGWWSERAHRLTFVLSRDGDGQAMDGSYYRGISALAKTHGFKELQRRREVEYMSVVRKFIAIATVATVTAGLAVAFSGAASGAAPALPSAIVSVHANPGQVSTRIVGSSCGGIITVDAAGQGGGYGRVACGTAFASASASPGGTFDWTYASPRQAGFVCQANATFASKGVSVTCTENLDD
jgi:hypothetical protein